MSEEKKIWVLPEIDATVEASSKTGLGLLSEARDIAAKVNGSVTALVFSPESRDYSAVLQQFGINNAVIFMDRLYENLSSEACGMVLLEKLQEEKPWLCLMGDTPLGQELAPYLAASLDAGLVSNCARIDHPISNHSQLESTIPNALIDVQ